MNTIRRLIFLEVLWAVGFVTLGFVSLFFFFDFVEELQSVGRTTHTYTNANTYTYTTYCAYLYFC